MRDKRGFNMLFTGGLLALAAMAGGCIQAPTLETPEAYDYNSQPILINNADWGVIPLPNNFLNPVKQAEFVFIPGTPLPESMPTQMALPIVDETAAAIAQTLGYPVVEDSNLTKSLIAGMNRLNGWVTNFAPKIPFSMLPEYDSIVPFDSTNGATANLFFLDITDPATPVTITPDKYFRVVNYDNASQYPYYLSLRLTPSDVLQAPRDFEAGHTYAVVITGINEDTGVFAVTGTEDGAPVGKPVQVDNTFLVFAAPDAECPEEGACNFKVENPITQQEVGLRYIGANGNPVNSVLTGLTAVQQAEGARQITNYVLKVWEQLDGVKDVRDRNEVVAAFQWTTASNPMPAFFDASQALTGGNGVIPSPADFFDGDGSLNIAKAKCNPAIGFGFKVAVDETTVKNDTVKLFKVTEGATPTLSPVDATVTPTTTDGVTSVLIKAAAALEPSTRYLVIATNGIKDLAGNVATDETYFGLTRTGLAKKDADGNVTEFIDTPLVSDDGTGKLVWNSPNLDSRLDTMILNHVYDTVVNQGGALDPVNYPIREVTAEMTQDAIYGDFLVNQKFGCMKVLANLEKYRAEYKPLFDAAVMTNKVVATREDIVLGWTFTTRATCE